MKKQRHINAKAKLNLTEKRSIKILSSLKQSHRMKPTRTVLFEKTNQSETKKDGRNSILKKYT